MTLRSPRRRPVRLLGAVLVTLLVGCGEGEVVSDAEMQMPEDASAREAETPAAARPSGGGGSGSGLRSARNAASSLEGRIAEQQQRTIDAADEDG